MLWPDLGTCRIFGLDGLPDRMLLRSITLAQLLTLAIVIILGVSMGACRIQETADKEPTPVLSGPPSTTFPMPPLKANSEMGWALNNGNRATLADYQGKVLVLDFYATWCAPCRDSIPRLVALQKKYGQEGLQVVGLNVGGPDDRIKVADFAKELGIPYPLGFPDKALTDLFLSDDQTIPQTFVFERQGRLAKRFIGYQDSTGLELEKVVQTQIAKTVNRK